ncbi:hypothetical protein Nmel_018881 [Mimus melanotis]
MCPKAQSGSQNKDHISSHPIPQSPFLGAPQLLGSRERFGALGGEECRGVRVKVEFEVKKPIREVDLGVWAWIDLQWWKWGFRLPSRKRAPSPLGLTSSSHTGGLS